ncbi:hypothetical protein GH714_018390 [Hevea brasiliensis]|uniref:FBD domain-containing protein n=1 Tax=Hevea brasiliensis TaxID=3981 RepID=A0A6A6LTJ2_HEVBR|nr:hypothetical protein GH714_018390 [Hevea brasiliensis]
MATSMDSRSQSHLPILNNSLQELKTEFCDFLPEGRVDWRSLKVLHIGHAKFTDEVMKNILSGSPLLESLKLKYCHGIHRLDIASKRMKKLVIYHILDLTGGQDDSALEIFSPHLEKLKILGSWGKTKCKLMNVSSLVSAVLDFQLDNYERVSSDFYEKYRNVIKELLEKIQHAKQLKIGTWCTEVLSILEVKAMASPLSTRKCLVLNFRYFKNWVFPGVANLLHNSPELEKLVIKISYGRSLQFNLDENFTNCYDIGESYWTSQNKIFNCLLLNLKTIEIFSHEEHLFENKYALAFVEFLLRNAKVLEKMVIFNDYPFHAPNKTDRLLKVAQKLLSVPRSSPHAVVLFPIPK